jgi:hypothetical protein
VTRGPQRPCPNCGSFKIVPILYGMPGDSAPPANDRFVWGGWGLNEQSPLRACKACNARFGTIRKNRGSAL